MKLIICQFGINWLPIFAKNCNQTISHHFSHFLHILSKPKQGKIFLSCMNMLLVKAFLPQNAAHLNKTLFAFTHFLPWGSSLKQFVISQPGLSLRRINLKCCYCVKEVYFAKKSNIFTILYHYPQSWSNVSANKIVKKNPASLMKYDGINDGASTYQRVCMNEPMGSSSPIVAKKVPSQTLTP